MKNYRFDTVEEDGKFVVKKYEILPGRTNDKFIRDVMSLARKDVAQSMAEHLAVAEIKRQKDKLKSHTG